MDMARGHAKQSREQAAWVSVQLSGERWVLSREPRPSARMAELCHQMQIYIEPVMVWSLMMYGAALSVAIVVPSVSPYLEKTEAKTPPSLKEVRRCTSSAQS